MSTTVLHPSGLPGIPYVFVTKDISVPIITQNPTLFEARDCILTEFKAFWDANPVSTIVPVIYQDVAKSMPVSGAWIEVGIGYNDGGSWAVGNILKRRGGQVSIKIHTPMGQGLSLGYELGIIALNALKGNNLKSKIWFRNGNISEAGIQGSNSVLEVTVDFVFSQLR